MNRKQILIAATLAGALGVTSAHAQTPDTVKTRIGDSEVRARISDRRNHAEAL